MEEDEKGQGSPPEVASGAARQSDRIKPSHLYKAIGLFFILAVFYRFFDEISNVLLLVFFSAIFAVLLDPLVKMIPLKRMWVAALVGLVVFGLLGGAVWLGASALVGQVQTLAENLPQYEQQLQDWETQLQEATGLEVSILGEDPGVRLMAVLEQSAPRFLGRVPGIVGAIAIPLIIFVGALYAVAMPNEHLLKPLMMAVPPERRPSFYRLFHLLGIRIGGWFRGRLLAMIAVGILSGSVLWVIGVPYSGLLAVIIGILEFIPLVGPFIGGAIAVIVALLDDPTKALWVVLAMIVIQQIESNVITPFAMSSEAEIHPLLTLFSLMFFGSLFGFLGVLLALPLVLLFATAVQVLWIERSLGSEHMNVEPVVEE